MFTASLSLPQGGGAEPEIDVTPGKFLKYM